MRVAIKCLTPVCRDALEDAARLALTFVTVTTTPGYSDFKASRDLELHLSARALKDGCHLPDLAQELMEAVQAYGIPVFRTEAEGEVSPEWSDWWNRLPEVEGSDEFELSLEIR
ncbi:MAG: hypothetical protein KC800_32235 [Candidatus Eremiobacteraeota bacterium]|nr:hypothetical protein [Candidatus Eremiobacteraeota bacterium]